MGSKAHGDDGAADYAVALLGIIVFFVAPFFASLKSFHEGDVMLGIMTFLAWFAILGITAVGVRI